jgi:hypothetical protein
MISALSVKIKEKNREVLRLTPVKPIIVVKVIAWMADKDTTYIFVRNLLPRDRKKNNP